MTTESMTWPDRMNPTDALFWFMDKIPEMRSTIGALVLLERAPSRARLRDEFERISRGLPRMRQRVLEVPLTLAPPEWVEDPQFDIDYHLRYLAVPEPGDVGELLSEVSPLYATSFDRDRPLWEAYVAEGLTGGRGALFVKMHHCLTDGVGGSRMFEELLTERVSAGRAPARQQGDSRSFDTWAVLWRAMLYNLQESVGVTRATAAALVDIAAHPVDTLLGLRRGLRTVVGFGRELAAPPVQSLLHQPRSLSRSLSTFEMAQSAIDAVRERLGATNNDIVLTIVSGAMHRWHTSRGSDVHQLRAMVPVSIRGTADAQAGNRLALLAVPLPIGEPNPLQRLRAIQERMGQVKTDRRATLYPLLARVMTALPLSVAAQIGRQQTSRTNFVCTNVPGPRRTCYLAGEAIAAIYPYAPLVGDHPVAIALYSYRDTMFVGLDVDSLAMDDLPHFRDALQESYDEILNIGRQTVAGSRGQRTRRRSRPLAARSDSVRASRGAL